MSKQEKALRKKRNIPVPHTYVIIFIIMIVCAILTYLLPAGVFDRVENEAGRMVVIADSYKKVASSPVSFMDFLRAFPQGLEEKAALIFFMFIAGGTFGVFDDTKAMDVSINKIAHRLAGKEEIMIIVITAIFSALGATMGFDPQCIIFVPLGVSLARRCGYDAITGVAMVTGGVYVGFTCGFMTPYTTVVAQGIAGIPLYSGAFFRIIWHIVTLIATCYMIIRYAKKVKKNPEFSYCYDLEQKESGNSNEGLEDVVTTFTVRQVLVVATLIIGLAIVILGSVKFGWGTADLSAVFFAMGIVAGVVGGLKANELAVSWINGAKTMVFGALAVGLGSAILVILQKGLIIDTIVLGLSNVLKLLPASLVAVGMLIANIVINFFVPSGSGQATLVMPFMASIAPMTGVTLQTAIVAFQAGDGFSNAVIPTSATTNASLGAANLAYEKWIKFAIPMFLVQTGIAIIFTIAASVMGLQ